MIIWSPGMSLEDMQEKVIRSALHYFNYDIETTARNLKISLEVFNKKILKYEEKEKKLKELKEEEKRKNEEFDLKSRGIKTEIISNPFNK